MPRTDTRTMNIRRLKLFILLGALFNSACGSNLVVQSAPDKATVFIKKPGGVDRVELGKTPLEITTTEMRNKADMESNSNEYRELVVELEGYTPQVLMLPPARFTTLKTTVFAKLELAPPTQVEKSEQMVQHLFNAQSFAQKSDFDKAQRELDEALAISDRFVRAISMRGTIFYLQGNYLDSLKWFEKALELDPKYEEAVKMITVIRQKVGPQAAAPGGGGK